jgi:hypothetical protein
MPVVAAAAVFAHARSAGLAKKIEQAMLIAADRARAQGKTNAQIKQAMMAARQKVKDDLDL